MYSIEKEFIEPYDLLFYYSPSIPYDFPKERIPKNICEKELLQIYNCYRSYAKDSDDHGRATFCNVYTSAFNQCKRRRDMQIFHEIAEWEKDRYRNLPDTLKPTYITQLEQELEQLKTSFEETSATETNQSKRWRINSDIMQTKWRLNNLSNTD